jgi:ketosteroid isomerase-like protein
MSTVIHKGEELYAALQTGDGDTLSRLLTPDFRGELTAGLPRGIGRVYDGLEAMISEGWGAVDSLFDMGPKANQLFDGGDVLIARGYYDGIVKGVGTPFHAAFAHFWPFDGARFTGVYQVTDSAAWQQALRVK